MILLALVALQEPADEPPGRFGPFAARTLSVFQSFRGGFIPPVPTTLRPGQSEAAVTGSWGNLWGANEDDWIVDYEAFDTDVRLSHAFNGRISATCSYEQTTRFGGRLDTLIERFHDVTHAEQRRREDFPRNQRHFNVDPRDSNGPLSFDSGGVFARSVTVEGQVTLIPDVAFSAALRHGSSDDIRVARVNAMISLSAVHTFGALHIWFSLCVSWYGPGDFDGVALRPFVMSALIAFEWRVAPGLSFILQDLITAGPFDLYDNLSRPAQELVIGWKIEASPGVVVEAGVLENYMKPDNCPDFGFQGGIRFRW